MPDFEPRKTAEKKSFRISVRELVEYRRRSGDLDSTFFASPRAVEGIRLHQKIQKERGGEYISELPVSYTVESEDVELTVSGRIDGVFDYSDRVVVEEIKTTRKDPDTLEIPDDHPYWAQVKCYGYMLACKKELDRIDLQLTCCNADTEKIRELARTFTFEELAAFFNALTDACLEKIRAALAWGKKRDQSSELLQFPFENFRPGQRRMAAAVYRTIRDKEQLIVQAPTGIGKTMAALFPSVKAMGLGLSEKIFYLTARTTGRSAAENALKMLNHAGLSIRSVTVTAKDKICLSPGSLCNPVECEFAKGHYDRVNAAMEELFESDIIDRPLVESVALKHRVCPFEFTLEAAEMADAIVCDYNYAFDPRVYLKRFFLGEKKNYAFLIDEAHNLVDRGREMFSASLSRKGFVHILSKIGKGLPRLFVPLADIVRWFSSRKKKCAAHGGFLAFEAPPESLYPLLETFVRQAEFWLMENRRHILRQEMLELYFETSAFLRVAGFYDSGYVSFFEITGIDIRVKLFCLDPSVPLKNALKRCGAAVFFSATMTPAGYFREVLGCEDSTPNLNLPSPFPKENCLVVVADRISTYYRRRAETKDQLSRILTALVEQKNGNYLFFFPSYQYLKMVLDIFPDATGETPQPRILVQKPGMMEAEREKFIGRFEDGGDETLAAFAVMGGIFGEGIDLAGERLSAAAVVGVGLPMICPERDLIRDYYRKKNGRGFDFAYKFPGINRVLQAAGRVIRSETDRGVVLLIDERFSKPAYNALLPEHLEIVKIWDTERLRKTLANFWGDRWLHKSCE